MGLQASAGFVAPANFKNLVETDRNLIRSAFGSRPGRVAPGDFAITPDTGLAVNVAAGRYVLRNRENEKQGFYHAWSDLSEVISWPTPSASPRIDTLVMRVADPQYGSVVGDPGGRWDIIQGVPAASPVARSDNEILTTFRVPGAWERIADVTVDPGATSFTQAKIADKRQSTISLGGIVIPSDVGAAGAYVGQYREVSGSLERWSGSAWVSALIDNPAWIDLPAASGWTAYPGGEWHVGRYRIGRNGEVRFRGTMLNTAGYTPDTTGHVMGTMPSGARPGASVVFGLTNQHGQLVNMKIQGDGAMVITRVAGAAPAQGTNIWHHMDSVRYYPS